MDIVEHLNCSTTYEQLLSHKYDTTMVALDNTIPQRNHIGQYFFEYAGEMEIGNFKWSQTQHFDPSNESTTTGFKWKKTYKGNPDNYLTNSGKVVLILN